MVEVGQSFRGRREDARGLLPLLFQEGGRVAFPHQKPKGIGHELGEGALEGGGGRCAGGGGRGWGDR